MCTTLASSFPPSDVAIACVFTNVTVRSNRYLTQRLSQNRCSAANTIVNKSKLRFDLIWWWPKFICLFVKLVSNRHFYIMSESLNSVGSILADALMLFRCNRTPLAWLACGRHLRWRTWVTYLFETFSNIIGCKLDRVYEFYCFNVICPQREGDGICFFKHKINAKSTKSKSFGITWSKTTSIITICANARARVHARTPFYCNNNLAFDKSKLVPNNICFETTHF